MGCIKGALRPGISFGPKHHRAIQALLLQFAQPHDTAIFASAAVTVACHFYWSSVLKLEFRPNSNIYLKTGVASREGLMEM